MQTDDRHQPPSTYANRLRLCSREVVLAIILTLGAVGLLIAASS